MGPAQRDGELVADLAAHGLGLGMAQMMRIGRPAVAKQARLRRHKPQMISVAPPPQAADGEVGVLLEGRW